MYHLNKACLGQRAWQAYVFQSPTQQLYSLSLSKMASRSSVQPSDPATAPGGLGDFTEGSNRGKHWITNPYKNDNNNDA